MDGWFRCGCRAPPILLPLCSARWSARTAASTSPTARHHSTGAEQCLPLRSCKPACRAVRHGHDQRQPHSSSGRHCGGGQGNRGAGRAGGRAGFRAGGPGASPLGVGAGVHELGKSRFCGASCSPLAQSAPSACDACTSQSSPTWLSPVRHPHAGVHVRQGAASPGGGGDAHPRRASGGAFHPGLCWRRLHDHESHAGQHDAQG